MADTKIHDLTSGSPALTTDELPVNRSGLDKKLTIADLLAISSNPFLACHSYAAATDLALATIAANTLTDMDATNAAITFTAPASGNVLVRASVLHQTSSSPNIELYWGLREGSTTVALAYLTGNNSNNESLATRYQAAFVIPGVTAGSHTYKLAHKITGGSAGAFTGPNYGQLILEVWAAP